MTWQRRPSGLLTREAGPLTARIWQVWRGEWRVEVRLTAAEFSDPSGVVGCSVGSRAEAETAAERIWNALETLVPTECPLASPGEAAIPAAASKK